MYHIVGAVVGGVLLLLWISYLLHEEFKKGYSEGLTDGIVKGRKLEKAGM